MSSPAHDIAVEFESQLFGLIGSDSGWSIAVASEPSLPDTAITIYDTPSDSEYEDLRFSQNRIQVRVRGYSYPDAYAKQVAIRNWLVDTTNFTRSGWMYLGIDMLGQIESIGRDESNRYLLTANYRLYRKEA